MASVLKVTVIVSTPNHTVTKLKTFPSRQKYFHPGPGFGVG